jgi:hypothetical protein
MPLQAEHVVQLVDRQGQHLGQITIEQIEADLVRGQFLPGPAFPSVQHLFQAFEEAVDMQALSVIDELDAAIARLGLCVSLSSDGQWMEVHDVQIWSDGSITCRIGSATVSAQNGELGKRSSVRAEETRERLTTRST